MFLCTTISNALTKENKMKKSILLFAFLFIGNNLFSQTWTVSLDEHWDIEWREVTKEQWERLLRQREEQNEIALLEFTDVLEMTESAKIIKGRRPVFREYYYCLGIFYPKTDEARILSSFIGGQVLSYGNDNTGEFTLRFFSMYGIIFPGTVEINSNEYNRRFNQCIKWVNGE